MKTWQVALLLYLVPSLLLGLVAFLVWRLEERRADKAQLERRIEAALERYEREKNQAGEV
jgi:hypothetical protein